MKTSWTTERLGVLCDVSSGGTPSRSRPEFYGGRIPWVKISDLNQGRITSTEESITEGGLDNCSAKLFPVGTVLLSIFATIGRTAVLEIEAATNQAIVGITPKNARVDSVYLKQFLDASAEELVAQGRGVAQSNINTSILKSLEVPFPPLEEQKRIAVILNKADEIRRKRQQAVRLTDTFLRSVFLDLFGDPVTNLKGWPIKPLSDGVASFEGGRNLMPTDVERSDRIRVLKVSAVTSGEYRSDASKSFAEDEEVQPDHIVRADDLLISRANTADLVGAVAYVWKTAGREMLPDKLWRFVWSNPRRIDPLFMLHMARSPYFRQQLFQRATGTSGSMKNIGKSKMLEIPIPFPPVALQETFAKIARRAQLSISRSQQARDESDALYAGLRQRAFRGEL